MEQEKDEIPTLLERIIEVVSTVEDIITKVVDQDTAEVVLTDESQLCSEESDIDEDDKDAEFFPDRISPILMTLENLLRFRLIGQYVHVSDLIEDAVKRGSPGNIESGDRWRTLTDILQSADACTPRLMLKQRFHSFFQAVFEEASDALTIIAAEMGVIVTNKRNKQQVLPLLWGAPPSRKMVLREADFMKHFLLEIKNCNECHLNAELRAKTIHLIDLLDQIISGAITEAKNINTKCGDSTFINLMLDDAFVVENLQPGYMAATERILAQTASSEIRIPSLLALMKRPFLLNQQKHLLSLLDAFKAVETAIDIRVHENFFPLVRKTFENLPVTDLNEGIAIVLDKRQRSFVKIRSSYLDDFYKKWQSNIYSDDLTSRQLANMIAFGLTINPCDCMLRVLQFFCNVTQDTQRQNVVKALRHFPCLHENKAGQSRHFLFETVQYAITKVTPKNFKRFALMINDLTRDFVDETGTRQKGLLPAGLFLSDCFYPLYKSTNNKEQLNELLKRSIICYIFDMEDFLVEKEEKSVQTESSMEQPRSINNELLPTDANVYQHSVPGVAQGAKEHFLDPERGQSTKSDIENSELMEEKDEEAKNRRRRRSLTIPIDFGFRGHKEQSSHLHSPAAQIEAHSFQNGQWPLPVDKISPNPKSAASRCDLNQRRVFDGGNQFVQAVSGFGGAAPLWETATAMTSFGSDTHRSYANQFNSGYGRGRVSVAERPLYGQPPNQWLQTQNFSAPPPLLLAGSNFGCIDTAVLQLNRPDFPISQNETTTARWNESNSNPSPTYQTTSSTSNRTKEQQFSGRCFNCNGTGHRRRDCPQICCHCHEKGHSSSHCHNKRFGVS